MVVLVLRVGRSVLDQLVLQRRLVGPDGLRVLLGEVHREVVRGVGARDRNHPAFVHLLGEALGDLYGVDLPPERPSKDALYQRFHPLFDVFEKTQRNLPSHPRYEVPEHPVYYSRETERNHIQKRACREELSGRRVARTPGLPRPPRPRVLPSTSRPTRRARRPRPSPPTAGRGAAAWGSTAR